MVEVRGVCAQACAVEPSLGSTAQGEKAKRANQRIGQLRPLHRSAEVNAELLQGTCITWKLPETSYDPEVVRLHQVSLKQLALQHGTAFDHQLQDLRTVLTGPSWSMLL